MVSLGMALFSTVVAMVTAWIAFRMRNLIGGVAWDGAACFLRATVAAARKASHRSPPY